MRPLLTLPGLSPLHGLHLRASYVMSQLIKADFWTATHRCLCYALQPHGHHPGCMLKLMITQVDCFCCAHLLCECDRHAYKCVLFTGGLGSIGLGSLGTFSGLNRPTPAVKTAADRAAEAAARIPDPQPGTPRQKKKAVSFVEDGQLACVRYFLKVSCALLLQHLMLVPHRARATSVSTMHM